MHKEVKNEIIAKMHGRGIQDDVIHDFIQKVKKAMSEPAFIDLDNVTAPGPGMLLEGALFQNLQSDGADLLNRLIIIKLNGGLSTTMGGRIPKGVLIAKDGLSYIEVVLKQMNTLREELKVNVPLVFMNSFFTHDLTMETVRKSHADVYTLIQSQVPRLRKDDFLPLNTQTDDDWSPPGHGDLYSSLKRSGMLREFLDQGFKWAFVSNLDNLAAYPEAWILNLIARNNIEFLLEVTDRTNADKKGGTPVIRNGKLELLEIAQVAPDQRMHFQDILRFPYFNTNNLWIDLEALEQSMNTGKIDLPLIQNYKSINGREIVQIETAMGAAVACFAGAKVLRVTRDRFFPTKKVSDLFVLQSDACVLNSMGKLERSAARPFYLPYMPKVFFSEDFIQSPLEISEKFDDPSSVSLLKTEALDVYGTVHFERDVSVVGRVEVRGGSEGYLVSSGMMLREGRYPPLTSAADSGDDGSPSIYPLELSRMAVEKPWGSQSVRWAGPKDMKNLPLIGELWETFDGPEEGSVILNGKHRLKPLREVVKELGPSVLGEDPANNIANPFPLLIKYLFPSQVLSIQVHPDDAYANSHEKASGKNEMWLVLNATPGSYIMVGWRPGLSPQDIKDGIARRDFQSIVNTIHPKAGDIFFIPAGTIHALGPGISVLEIQQNSDITYRIYDWDRVDANGAPRALHLEKAFDVLDLNYVSNYQIKPCTVRQGKLETSYLCACDYFAVCRWIVKEKISVNSDPKRFWLLNIVGGQGYLNWENGDPIWMEQGTTLLIPANLGRFAIEPAGFINIIKSWVPDLMNDIITPLRENGFSNGEIVGLGGNSGNSTLSTLIHQKQ